jgi:hypothetical protein
MATTERVAEKIECVAHELLDYAQELRRGEGDWRWQPATLAAQNAVRAALAMEESPERKEPETFKELGLA